MPQTKKTKAKAFRYLMELFGYQMNNGLPVKLCIDKIREEDIGGLALFIEASKFLTDELDKEQLKEIIYYYKQGSRAGKQKQGQIPLFGANR